MPWEERSVVDERMRFIVDWQRDEMSVTQLCGFYGVSRRTGYKWLARYEEGGPAGLEDRSRAPHHHPNAVEEPIERAILALKQKRRHWGPKKLRAWLMKQEPGTRWPAESTIGVLLDRHGLVRRRRRRRHVPPGASPLSACLAPNEVWGIDFKGWFLTGDGRRCDPLSVSDLATRYVLRLQAVGRCDLAHVWPVLEAAFHEFGLPKVMRSDNGPPFAGTGAGGLSRLAVRLIKADVMPERITPGRPQQNGRHERLHRTVKQETASPPAPSLRQQQRRFDDFRRIFNAERPHEALGQTPPALHYQPSARSYSGRLREPDYAEPIVRRVRHSGEIKWHGELIFLSEVLAGEPVGLAEIDDDRFRVSYGPVELGVIDAAGKFAARKAGARPRLARQPQPPG